MYSEEHIAEIQDLKVKLQDFTPLRISGSKILNVPLYKQMNNCYCGPTSVRMTLKSLGIDKKQSTLAADMNTNAYDDTYVYQIVHYLNKYLGQGAYKYVQISEIGFDTGLLYSINQNKPVICHVMTGKLPNYAEKGGHNTGHYIVATGYVWGAQGSSGTSKVMYNDPNNNEDYYGRWTTTWGNMTTVINENSGFYIMAS